MHTYKPVSQPKGSTDLERRDRALGALLTLIGFIAIANIPEAREAASYMNSNAFGAQFTYQLLFVLAFMVVIGPCLMLPHRAGVMPLAAACLFAYLQIQAEFDADARQQTVAKQSVEISKPRTPLGG